VSIGVTAAALAGCGGGHSRSGATGATVPTGPTATTVDVAHVPATIDTSYAQHVMDALDQVLGDAIRVFVANKGPNQQFVDLLSAVYDEPQYSREVADYGRDAARNLQGYSNQPGNPVTKVTKVIGATSSCILLGVDRDFGRIFNQDPAADKLGVYVQLSRKNDGRDPSRRNLTAWTMVADGSPTGGKEPSNPCR
jgi:hypothetical protein